MKKHNKNCQKTILMFSAYFEPEIAASMYLTQDILHTFVDKGYHIRLYCPMPCRGVDDETRRIYAKQKKNEERYGGKLRIHRFSLYKEPQSTVKRFIRYYILIWKWFFKGLFVKADVIFAQSTPPIIGLLLSKLKFWKRIPVVYNLQDVFPDSLVNTGLTHKGSVLWKTGRRIEKKTYRTADRIIVISDDFKKNIVEKGVPENKIVVVPNWSDNEGVCPIDRKDDVLFDRYHLDREKFYIAYSGNIGYTQNMDLMLDVAKRIKEDLPDVVFAMIGNGAAREDVENRVKNERIDNVVLLPFQPYEDIAHVFSLGDVGLIISKPGVGNNSVPSKTWSIMSAGRPVLASFDSDSELCDIVRKTGCGAVAPAGDAEALVAVIRELYEKRDTLAEVGKRGRTYVETYLDKEKCTGEYVKTLKSLLGDEGKKRDEQQ